MTRSRLAIAITPVLAAMVIAAPAPAEAGWFGLHIGTGGIGVSVGFGSWWAWTDEWANGPADLDFDVALAGYGEWVWVDGLGRVWRPWVAADWRPYTNGRWVWTNLGWTWVAYEPWGYLPHHFGNWAMTPVGWTWVPGTVYTPASVMWVGSGGLVGWYACPPHGWSHARRGFWNGYDHGRRDGYASGYRDGWEDARYANFVGWDHLADDDLSRRAVVGYAVPRGSRVQALATPPSRTEVVRRSGRPVPQARLEQRTVRIAGREVGMARPAGLEHSVESHADDTMRRVLSPRVSSDLDSARTRREHAGRTTATQGRTLPTAAGARSQRSPDVLRSQPARSPSPHPAAISPRASRRTEPIVPSPQRPSATGKRLGSARIQPAPATRAPSGTARTPRTARSAAASPAPASRETRVRQAGTTSRSSAVSTRSAPLPTVRRVQTGARNAPARAGAKTPARPAARTTTGARNTATTARPAPRGKTKSTTTGPARTRRRRK